MIESLCSSSSLNKSYTLGTFAGHITPASRIFMVSLPAFVSSLFIGRQEYFSKLEEYFTERKKPWKRRSFLLYGMGGIGKSQIALKFAQNKQQSKYYSIIFWIDATSESTIVQSLKDIQIKYDHILKNSLVSSAKNENRVLDWISHYDQQEWLLIYDNADQHNISLLKKYIPAGEHGNILITSRNSYLARITDNVKEAVSEMHLTEALELFFKASNLQNSDVSISEHAKAIVTRLGFIPLAVDLAGSSIAGDFYTLDDYLDLLDKNREVILKKTFNTDQVQSIYESWNMSFKAIQKIFHCAAVSKNIENDFIANKIYSDFLSLTKDNTWDFNNFRSGVHVLLASSLVKKSMGKKCTVYSLHPVVHWWCYDRLEESKRQSLLEVAIIIMAKAIPTQWNADDHIFLQTLNPHLIYNDFEMENRIINEQFANAFYYNGDWQRAEHMQYKVLETYKDKFEKNDSKIVEAMSDLASIYWNQGRWKEAEELELQVLELRKKVLGEECPDTLRAMANLAHTYGNQGRWKEAEELELQVLELWKKVLGDKHPDTLKAMANLAYTYRNQGRGKEAEELELQVLELWKKVLGEEHPDTLRAMANLAYTYGNQGRWKEAEELELQVLELWKKVLGDKHPDTLKAMANLAYTYGNQGRGKEAEELELQVLELRKKVLGEEHPDTLRAMANLAYTYGNQGRWKEAEELELQVLELWKKVLGDKHPDTLKAMANLAYTYGNQGRGKEAEELELQVLELRKKVLGEEHPDTLRAMSNLACTYGNQGRWKEAEELELQVLELWKKVLGDKHPDTLKAMAHLAYTYGNQGRGKEAEELELQVLELRKKVLGEEHPDTLRAMANLACTYRNQSRWKEAEELELQVLELRKKVLGEEHPDTLRAVANLACTYQNQGRWTEAEELQLQV
ncbi:hypothetical protein IW261DRAFT_1642335 [Armillaria novae-zelandiae]|uniref:NB-ARC domain-containing protein n=1 Tax=Armillaria novae-zelandiae TaxID=153914 RepID=A0AA39P3X2_9AGAR|nr:hypothetical protein IW261DRAFT_1642335 [Armillaria novae-zelandiae]